MDLDVYKRRLGAKTQSDALVENSIKQVKSVFKNSPNFKTLIIDGVEKDVRVNTIKDGEKELLLQPEDSVDKGAMMDIDGENWIVTKFKPNIIYPKATIILCNQILKWSDNSGVYEFPCIAKGKGYKLYEKDDYMLVPEGDITLLTQYNDHTKKILETQRFIFGDNAYRVSGIDNITHVVDESGILQLTFNRVFKSDKDDIDSDIASNSNDNGWKGGWEVDET